MRRLLRCPQAVEPDKSNSRACDLVAAPRRAKSVCHFASEDFHDEAVIAVAGPGTRRVPVKHSSCSLASAGSGAFGNWLWRLKSTLWRFKNSKSASATRASMSSTGRPEADDGGRCVRPGCQGRIHHPVRSHGVSTAVEMLRNSLLQSRPASASCSSAAPASARGCPPEVILFFRSFAGLAENLRALAAKGNFFAVYVELAAQLDGLLTARAFAPPA